jgi:glycosyltransferase involved in cell wall biosynthesis
MAAPTQWRRMRICELILAPAFGGAETLALDLAASFRDAGHEVEVVALDPSVGPAPGAPGEILVASRPRYAKGHKLGRLAAMRRLTTSGRYDVIHAHSYLPNLYARAAAALSVGRHVPVVVTLLSGGDDFATPSSRRIEVLLQRWTDVVVAMGERLRDEYEAYFPRMHDRIVAIPFGVDRPALSDRVPSSSPMSFAMVGRIAPQKEVETALRGFAAFVESASGTPPVLKIIGPPSDEKYAQSMRALAESIAPKSVRFLGAQREPFAHEEIDVLIHCAGHEAHTPLAILEAAAHGIPIVCSDAGSMASAIGWHCTKFRTGSPEQLTQALLHVRSKWPEAVRIARKAWEAVPVFADTARRYERVLLRAVTGESEA